LPSLLVGFIPGLDLTRVVRPAGAAYCLLILIVPVLAVSTFGLHPCPPFWGRQANFTPI